MIKDEKAELIINGELIENDYTFTFDASEFGGKQIVTFEELYDISNPDEPINVAEHKDIEDEGQTITITEVPKLDEPKQPDTTDIPKHNTSESKDLPNTGDTTNPAIFILGMAVSITALGVVSCCSKKEKAE